MSKLFMTVMLCLAPLTWCGAQHIKRKGSLGVGFYQKVSDSLAPRVHYKEGALVQFVVPQTTAALAGVQINDIITRINNMPIVVPNDIFIAAKTLREQDNITLSVIRNNNITKLSGTVIPKPKEKSTTADVVYGEFAYKKGYVRTIYKAPKGTPPLGTIYFLQGLPCYSMDNFKDLDITKQAIDAMVARGFAVYRMEKADMGDNVNMPPCETMGFTEELAMYKAGYENLLRIKGVDTTKILLFGHSMGGLTAPLLAAQFQPKAVVVYGTVFKPWMDYLFDAFLLQSQYYGEDLALLRDQLEVMKPAAYDYFYNNKSADEICKTQEGQLAMASLLSYDISTKLAASGRSPLCHKELNQYNMAQAWKHTNSYVLAIYGECDIAAIHPDDHMALIDYVNKVHPGKGTFWEAPKTTHNFEEIGTMAEFVEWQKDPAGFYQYAATRFNPKVFDYACNWMKEALAK